MAYIQTSAERANRMENAKEIEGYSEKGLVYI